MKISTKGRYATRVMLDLALHDTGECIKAKDIAARQGISEKYLEQIISILNKAGYVKSVRGAQGPGGIRRGGTGGSAANQIHGHSHKAVLRLRLPGEGGAALGGLNG